MNERNPLDIDVMRRDRLPVITACLINKKEITINKELQMVEKGPCGKLTEGFCKTYFDPTAKWKNGDCPMATHIIQVDDVEKFVNPIKKSKRGG